MNSSSNNAIINNYKANAVQISSQHPVISLVKHIRNNTSDDNERCFLAEGIWAHQVLTRINLIMQYFIVCPELIHSVEADELVRKCMDKARNTYIVSRKLFEKISDRDDSDGFASIIMTPGYKLHNLKIKSSTTIVVIDGLEKPGNIGTILRTCDGAGADAVFICNKKARITNPKLVKASMGAVFTLPIVEIDDIGSCTEWLRANNFNIYLADTRAEKTYQSFDYEGNTALVIGNERYGISKDWYSCNPQLVSIPMLGICDSLNVGVAGSIITYEICVKKLQRCEKNQKN